MNKRELRTKYPFIANTFESVLYEPNNAKKYRLLIYNYSKPERGISFERIFEILDENKYVLKLEVRKLWYE